MPATLDDLKALGYEVGLARAAHDPAKDVPPTRGRVSPAVYTITGAGFSGLHVAVSSEGTGASGPDQEVIDSLADPGAKCERDFQNTYDDATTARATLEKNGYTVTRTDPEKDVFVITDPKGAVVAGRLSPQDLVKQAEALPPL